MTETIEFARPDGKTCPAYLAVPRTGSQGPGIVVIQEWWGLNEQIKKTADRFAEAGFRALVPDLFRGKLAADASEANHLMSSLDFMDAAQQDIRGAVQHMKKFAPGKIAVGGFCMGGALTILSALKVPEMDAGACFYGIPPKAAGDPSQIRVPMIFHFATHDDWCTPPVVAELEQSLKAGNVPHELYRYDAQHAFMNERRPEVYDAGAAQQAWQRSIDFLQRTLA
jgi:carboxymethylenebutenolidase